MLRGGALVNSSTGQVALSGDDAHKSGKFTKRPRVGIDGSCDIGAKYYEVILRIRAGEGMLS